MDAHVDAGTDRPASTTLEPAGHPPARKQEDSVIIGGAQLLLAEKRTSLAVMRTGIAVLALPMGVLSLLVATSRYYSLIDALHLFIPLLVLCLGLVALGTVLVVRAFQRIRHCDATIRRLRAEHGTLRRFLE